MIATPSNIARAPFCLGQCRAIAEGVARIERVPVADRRMHVPAKIRCGAIEPVVDQVGDFRAAGKGAVKRIMVDPVFGEQLRKSRTIVLFNRVAEDAKHGGGCLLYTSDAADEEDS